MKLILVIRVALEDKNGSLQHQFPLSELNVVVRASMHHLVLLPLRLLDENVVQLLLDLSANAAAHILVGFHLCLVDGNSRQLLAKDQMVLDVLVLRHLLEDEAQDLLEVLLGLGLHIAPNVLSFLLELPLEAGKLLPRLVDGKGHHIHVQVNGQLVLFRLIASELKSEVVSIFEKSNGGHLQSV